MILSGAVLLLGFVLVTGGVAYKVVWSLIHPTRIPITETPEHVGLAYHPIEFKSLIDHISLSGWLIPAAKPTNKLVIEAHGYHQNRESDKPALPVAAALHKAGYAVLMFDFRDEGLSKGHEVTVGLFEQRDLEGAVKFAKSMGYDHIGIIGYSMGAATALEVASKDPTVQAVVADSPFANLYRYLKVHMPEWTHLPNWPFTPEIFIELRLINGLDVKKVDPEKDIAGMRHLPILLIAGTADHVVPMRNSLELYRSLHNDPNAKLWIVTNAGHVGAYKVMPKKYLERVTVFFEHAL